MVLFNKMRKNKKQKRKIKRIFLAKKPLNKKALFYAASFFALTILFVFFGFLFLKAATVNFIWDFDNPTDYSYDTNKIDVSGGMAKLKAFDQTDDDNSANGFSGGSFNQTQWNTDHVELSAGNSTGTFTSRIFDAGANVSWNNLTWMQGAPYQQELPNNKQIETVLGGIDMTGNVLLLHMNESIPGPIVDNSGEGNNGTYFGYNFHYNQPGEFGSAIGFDPADRNSIDCGNSSSLNITSDITLSVWINWNGTGPAYQHIISRYLAPPNNSYAIILNKADGKIFFYTRFNESIISTIPISTGTWHHIAATWKSGISSLYIDGQLNNSGAKLAPANIPGLNLRIGNAPSGSYAVFYDGLMDEIGIWNRALSATDIANMYKRGVLALSPSARSCNDNACIGESWNVLNDLSPQALSLPGNRYFQYKFDFATENLAFSPTINLATAGPDHYPADKPTISNTNIVSYNYPKAFTEMLGAGNQGNICYQISPNNSAWYYWNGSVWAQETGLGYPAQTNASSDINAHISSFSPNGNFYFKAFLVSDGSQQTKLDGIELGYDTSPPILPNPPAYYTPSPPPIPQSEEEIAQKEGYEIYSASPSEILKSLADKLGTTVEKLLELNKGKVFALDGNNWIFKYPKPVEEIKEEQETKEEQKNEEQKNEPIFLYYIVKPGDSLHKIALSLGTTSEELIKLNKNIYPSLETSPDIIRIGWQLKYSVVKELTKQNVYIIQPGDYLSKIAAKLGVAIETLINLNKNTYPSLSYNPSDIHAGWELRY